MDAMDKQKHGGTLLYNENEWYFLPGTKIDNPHNHLQNFEENIMYLIESH